MPMHLESNLTPELEWSSSALTALGITQWVWRIVLRPHHGHRMNSVSDSRKRAWAR